jgi:hypothetical protein
MKNTATEMEVNDNNGNSTIIPLTDIYSLVPYTKGLQLISKKQTGDINYPRYFRNISLATFTIGSAHLHIFCRINNNVIINMLEIVSINKITKTFLLKNQQRHPYSAAGLALYYKSRNIITF